uniref:C2H2-type domain-containing protein n=1 Tax=Strongyloides venezuelensis TaxID=75913 RepID=A0A0K0F7X4_STRVS
MPSLFIILVLFQFIIFIGALLTFYYYLFRKTMEELNCTLCDRKALTKDEAIKHVFKDHLNYVPWTCSECTFEAYKIGDKHFHECETTHIMIEAGRYTSNFRIFGIIYCDMRYIRKFGEENLDKCRIIRPPIETINDDNTCNDNNTNKNNQVRGISNDCIRNIDIGSVKKNKSILKDQENTQESNKIPMDVDKEHLNLSDGVSPKVSEYIFSRNEMSTFENNIKNTSDCSNTLFQEEITEACQKDDELQENIKKNVNDEKESQCKVDTFEPLNGSTKKRGIRERITYDKNDIDDSYSLDSYNRPNKKKRSSYDVLKPTLSSNRYVLEYAFILDGDKISKLLPSSNVTHCKLCKRGVRNENDIINHIRYYHNTNQEYKSPLLSCSIKRCGCGFDDMSKLKNHAIDYHNVISFANNIDVRERKREKHVHVNITANGLLKYEQLFIECFPNLILRYCQKRKEKNESVQLFLSYSSKKCDYLSSGYLYKKANGKDHIDCCICKKKVPVERYLIRHVIENHMNRKDENYNILACQECKEPKYYDMDDLEKHWERKHTDIGPFFNNYHIKFDKSPMQYTCVASIMSKDDLKAYEEVFEQAYPDLKINI